MASNKKATKDKVCTKFEESLVQAMVRDDIKSQRQAYKASLYKSDTMLPTTMDAKASIILRRVHVKARYEELQNTIIKAVEKRAIFTVESILIDLKAILDRNVSVDDKIALETLKTAGKHLGMFIDKQELIVTKLPKIVLTRGKVDKT